MAYLYLNNISYMITKAKYTRSPQYRELNPIEICSSVSPRYWLFILHWNINYYYLQPLSVVHKHRLNKWRSIVITEGQNYIFISVIKWKHKWMNVAKILHERCLPPTTQTKYKLTKTSWSPKSQFISCRSKGNK